MAEEEDETAAGGPAPAGPFLREYAPLGALPAASAQRASVLFYRNGGYSVITVSGVRHVDKRALARPYNICEVAQGTYVSPLQLELPAAGGTSFFKAEVDIEWEVHDPYLAAVQVVTDVAARLTSPVLERLREITLTYRVTDAEQANRVITRECVGGRWSDLGNELGLRVRLYVRLGVNDEAIEYAKQRRGAQADAEVTRVRQDSFRRMLQGGELEQLSFMLAADPEGAKDFLEKIRQEGRQDERERVDRLYTMALKGELHAADVESQVLDLLNQGRRRPLQGPIGAVPARREPRELEAAAEGPFTPEWVSDEPPRRTSHRGESHRAETYRTESHRIESTREVHRAETHRDDDAVMDEPPFRTGRRTEPHPADDQDRGPSRGPARRPEPYPADDYGREPSWSGSYRPEPDRADDYGRPPQRARTARPELEPADDYDPGPPRSPAYRAERDRGDDRDRGPSRGPARRPEPYPADDYGREPSWGGTYRPQADPADDYDREPWSRAYRAERDRGDDRDREPSPGRAHRPGPYPPDAYDGAPAPGSAYRPDPAGDHRTDDHDREPPRGRRRPRDDGWSWAEEDG
ncbi:hypothetical protein [Streptomyces sp. NPDC059168]|uniref:hypothetical protein n=1 Tax=Streptomyces sp. NPDC059168 TaxID=3346753 RepID=UPI0036A61B4B